MRGPRAFHLPASSRWERWRPLGETSLHVPDLPVSAAETVWKELDRAAAAWRQHPLKTRVAMLSQVLQKLRRRGPGPWRSVLGRSTGLSPEGLDAAWEVTFAPHTEEALAAALKAENLDAEALAAMEGAGRLPRRLAHVLAGNVLAPTVSVLLRGWILGAAQWLRPAGREPLMAACLMEDLSRETPVLAACTAVLWWPHDAEEWMERVLCAADGVTVQGSDATLAVLDEKRRRWSACPPWVPYGSRWSAACVAAASQTPETAAAVARDVALFDQQGCLSPTVVFAERTPALFSWCRDLAAALDAEERRMPRGPLPARSRAALRHWHENARLAVVLADATGFWENGTLWGVVLRGRCEMEESPLERHVSVVPYEDWRDIVQVAGASLQTLQGLALAPDGWSDVARAAILRHLRPSRVASPGRLQEAPLEWPQDHRAPLGSLIRPA